MKKFKTVMICATAALLLVGCGKNNNNNNNQSATASPTAEATVTAAPTRTPAPKFEITDEDYALVTKLGEYKDYKYKPFNPEATYEEVDEFLKADFDAAMEDGFKGYEEDADAATRAIVDGDTVNVDFKGFIDDNQFAGGTGSNVNLTIGSDTFIDTFEDQLIGAKKGDVVTVNVTFPEDYGQEDLNGKPAKFEVTINYICKEVEVTFDNYYKYLPGCDFKSNDELREYVKVQLEAKKAATLDQYFQECQNDYVASIVENSEFGDISGLVDSYYNYYYSVMEGIADENGSSIEAILPYLGYENVEEYQKAMKEDAETTIKHRLVMGNIAKLENIELSDEDYKTYADSYLSNTTYESIDDYKKSYDAYYGEGSFDDNILQLHYVNVLFGKYSSEEAEGTEAE